MLGSRGRGAHRGSSKTGPRGAGRSGAETTHALRRRPRPKSPGEAGPRIASGTGCGSYRSGPGMQSRRTCRRSTQSFEPYTISSMDWLELGSPDSTKPAYRIHGACSFAGRTCRSARRTSSAMGIPSAAASFLTKAYSPASRLICVRIITITNRFDDNTSCQPMAPRCAPGYHIRGVTKLPYRQAGTVPYFHSQVHQDTRIFSLRERYPDALWSRRANRPPDDCAARNTGPD